MGEFDTPRPAIELFKAYLPEDVANAVIEWCRVEGKEKELSLMLKTPTSAIGQFDWNEMPYSYKYWRSVFAALYYGRKVPGLPKETI